MPKRASHDAFECSSQLLAFVHSMPSVKTVDKASLPVVPRRNGRDHRLPWEAHEPDGLRDELAMAVPQHASRLPARLSIQTVRSFIAVFWHSGDWIKIRDGSLPYLN